MVQQAAPERVIAEIEAMMAQVTIAASQRGSGYQG
jgi:hypothetical protein